MAIVILNWRRYAGHHRPLDRTKSFCQEFLVISYFYLPWHGEVSSSARLWGQISCNWLVLWKNIKLRFRRIKDTSVRYNLSQIRKMLWDNIPMGYDEKGRYQKSLDLTDEEIMFLTLILWPDWWCLEEGPNLVSVHQWPWHGLQTSHNLRQNKF